MSEVTTLGEVAQVLNSRRVPLSKAERSLRAGSFPYYGATGVLDYVDGYLFDGLHLLIGEDGTVTNERGRPMTQLVSGQFWVSNHAHVVLGEDEIDTRFIYYALANVAVQPFVTGSAQPKLSLGNLRRIPLAWPTRSRRIDIVGVLVALDDKIESNQRIAKTIRELLAVEFQQRFGAMSARTTLRQLVARVNKAVQTGPFGTNLHASDYGDDGVPLVLVKHVLNGEIADVGLPLVVADKASELASYRLSKDDIVITRVGRVGDAALVRGTQDGWLFSGQMLRVNLAEVPQIDPYWLVQWYQTSEFRDLISAYSVGSTRESLSTSILADAPMPLVEHPAQASFRDVAEPLHRRWAAAARESRNLSELRDALLPELLSGRLRVADAQKVVEEAV